MNNRAARQGLVAGLREHAGLITVKAEPNTAPLWMRMVWKELSKTGAGPFIYTYTEFVKAIEEYDGKAEFPTYRRELMDFLVGIVEG